MTLLSKHVREIIPLRITDVVLRSPEQSSALYDYVTEDIPSRAPYLRSIRALWAPESESRYQAYVDMSLLGEIIRKATQLRELECASWLVEVVSLKDVQGLENLTHLKLAGWPSKLQDLSSLPSSLCSLSFTAKSGDSSYSPSYSPAFVDFMQSISHLSCLHTLLFEDIVFQQDANWPRSASGVLPIHSSVTTLRLLSVILPWTTADPLRVVFPNLSTLELTFSSDRDSLGLVPDSNRNGAEPPFVLRHLQLAINNSEELQSDYIPSSWKVNRLTLQVRTPDDLELVGLSSDHVEDLVHLTVDNATARGGAYATFVNVMHGMASCAISLRSLEFIFRVGDFTDLLLSIANAYSSAKRSTVQLPLICLSIRAPSKIDHALWKVVYRRDQFLEAVCNQFPSLRYIALADVPVDFEGDDDEKRHWWRVIRDDESTLVEVREVPLWEGRRVRDYFLDADADTATQFEDIIAFYDELRTERYIYFASVSLLFYDFIVTFGREVNLFWSKKLSGASALFFFIRYVTVAYEILDVISSVFTFNDQVRSANLPTEQSLIPGLSVFSAMRAHGLLKNWVLSVLILILSLMPLVNFAMFPLGLTGMFDPVIGCVANIVRITPNEPIIVSRSGLILADFILIVVTWVTLAIGPARPRLHLADHSRRSLAAIMLWNGLIYFMVLFVLNALHLSFTLTSIFGIDEPSNITLFTDPLTSVLTWHFLLDLQEANQRDLKLDSDDPLHISMSNADSLNFARVMGSIGSIVVPGADDLEDEDLRSSQDFSNDWTAHSTAAHDHQESEIVKWSNSHSALA
ncbi:hypothetical protein C8T65DRAFT_740799 [Cerioporus squamosus]|nr:hypothetical protein C8T65DRAFT_740799 [Cerioporus squamosus]